MNRHRESNQAPLERPLLTPEETAHRLGLSLRALAELRRHGRGPRYIRLTPATIRYLADDLDPSSTELSRAIATLGRQTL